MADSQLYLIIENNQEQMALWQPERPLPSGWHKTGQAGSKEECLDYMLNEWMRAGSKPKSRRRRGEPSLTI